MPLPAGLLLSRGGEAVKGTSRGVLGSVKEMKAGDGMVLLASVCDKRRDAEMKEATGHEHVGKTALNMEA